MERLNLNFKKKVKKGKTGPGDNEKEDQLTKICYKYVFDEFVPKSKQQKAVEKKLKGTEDDLDLQLLKLNKQLEAEKNELEMQKLIWLLVLKQSKASIQNYRQIKNEIDNLENLSDVMMN